MFYYRRVRKMGMLEFLAFIFGIFTVGHFIVAWSIYLEKKFELVGLKVLVKLNFLPPRFNHDRLEAFRLTKNEETILKGTKDERQ